MKILVMGVSGCGKTSFGRVLAQALNLPFYDADDFHSPQAVARMSGGKPLSDQDRLPWLQRLAALLRQQEAAQSTREPGLVLACSALRRRYRDLLREAAPGLRIFYLQGDFDLILQRIKARSTRKGHFFSGATMLQSQFDSLEEPEDETVMTLSIEQSIEDLLPQALIQLQQSL